MDGKQASEVLGKTYRQLNYMLKQVDGLVPVEYGLSIGKARDITAHDLTRLTVAFMLKDDSYNYAEIQKAISLINDNWDGATPDNAGVLLALGDGSAFNWALDTDLAIDGLTSINIYRSLPRMFYNVRKVANEIYL